MTRLAMRPTLAAVVLSCAWPIATGAQQRSVELGTDAQLAFRRLRFTAFGADETESATQLMLPKGLRAGFFLSPRTSLEVNLELNYVNPSEGDGFTAMTLGVGPMIHLSFDPARPQGYLRPILGVNYVNTDETRSQAFFGGAAGIKVPATSHAATRYEVMALLAPANDPFPRETRIGVNVGFSVFFP